MKQKFKVFCNFKTKELENKSIDFFIGCKYAYFNNSDLTKIKHTLIKKKNEFYYLPWNRPIIKISNLENPKQSIYRRIFSGNSHCLHKDEMVIDWEGFETIKSDDEKCGDEIELKFSKSWFFPYYWRYYEDTVRCAFRLGVIAIVISIVAFILQLIC